LRRRKACDRSLWYFIKDVGGYMPKSGGDASPIIHKPIFDAWQDHSILRLAAFEPRGWRKTTHLTILGNLWEYLQNNEVRILIPSEKEDTASKWVGQIGNHVIRNARLRWMYPELQLVDRSYTRTRRWSTKCLEFPRVGVYPEGTIQCVGIRGASQGGHFDIVAPDDLVGEKGFESPVVMEDAFRWFDNIEELLIEPDMNSPRASLVRLKGTHWGVGDLGIYIQENYREYKWFIVPALKDAGLQNADNITWLQNPDSDPGESNWPEVFSTKYYMDMRANPEKEAVFYAQHMNNPRDESILTKFDGAWLRYYRFDKQVLPGDAEDIYITCEDDGKQWRVSDMTLFGMIDPGGFAETRLMKKGSRNALVIGGQPRDSNRKFIIDTWCGRLKDPSEFLDQIFAMDKQWGVRLWMVETFGAQKYIFKDILEARRVRKANISIQEMPRDVSKDIKNSDILGLLDPMKNGEIYVHRSMKELIGEIRTWPSSLTQDLLDMSAKLMKYRFQRRSKEELDKLRVSNPPYPVLVDSISSDSGVSSITGY
jgi:hypothetical protein